ncbi:MAG: hypothetical protein P4M12_08205 [Gammaproteobacteria bacterium]|nr:hypothetical protein [Gammaproteobacteria bacterium]
MKINLTLLCFYAFICASILSSLASNFYAPESLDLLNHLALISEAKSALVEGQFPIKDTLGHPSGIRYPVFQFYSPTLYTISGYINRWIAPENPYITYKLTLWLSLMFAGIFMQRLAKLFIESKPAAILTSVLYLTSTYNLICINHLCTYSETIAYCLLPALLFYLVCFYHHFGLKNFILASLLWYALITIHLITFMYTSMIFGILFLTLLLNHTRDYLTILKLGLPYITGILLATWYLAPISLLSSLLNVGDTFNSFKQFFPSIFSLLSSNANYIQLSESQAHTTAVLSSSYILPAISFPIVLGAYISIYLFLNRSLIVNSKSHYWLPAFIIAFLTAFFLTWSPINIWKWLPQSLQAGQYSWRLLNQTSLFGALLAGYAICWISKYDLKYSHVLFGTIIIFASVATWLPSTTLESQSLIEFMEKPRMTMNANTYLIKPSLLNSIKAENQKTFSLEKSIQHCKFTSGKTSCNLFIPNNISLLELPVHYYPKLLEISLNGKSVQYDNATHNGYLIVTVAPDAGKNNTITVQFRGLTWANNTSKLVWYAYFTLCLYTAIRYFLKSFARSNTRIQNI